MTVNSISFPNLHITFPFVPKTISVFGFEIAIYGIIMASGMILAGIFVLFEAKRLKLKQDDYLDLIIWGLIGGIVGARLYYVAFSWNDYKDNLLQIFNFRAGGLAIYGAVIGGVLAGFIVCKVRKMSFFGSADMAAFGLLIGQVLGRWGNFCNREAFGTYTNGTFAMLIPYDMVNRTQDITDEMMRNMVTVDGINCISVHPTFLYESLWNLGVLIFLLIYRYRKKFNGELFFLYLGLYGAGRAWIEGLRTDPLLIGNTNIRVSQVLALVLVFGSAIFLAFNYTRLIRKKMEPLPRTTTLRKMKQMEAEKIVKDSQKNSGDTTS